MDTARSSPLLDRLGIALPVVQAPMAGVSTPAMTAAVSEAGALGSIAVGATDPQTARAMIAAVRAATGRPFGVNVFCHAPARSRPAVERAWIDRMRPQFAAFGAAPPESLSEIYRSFAVDEEMLAVLVEARPAMVSFHFGLPPGPAIRALREAGIVLAATATSLAEARAIESAGLDAIVAQGWEAGGHRGSFDPLAPDEELSTLALTRLLVRETRRPVIAAGGLMDGVDVAAVLDLGAVAAQLGTAFVGCPESAASGGYRAALAEAGVRGTVMTRVISGRPARCLANRFTALGGEVAGAEIPDYPVAYDLGKALDAAARARGEYGFGAQWAGEGAAKARALPAAAIVAALAAELGRARA